MRQRHIAQLGRDYQLVSPIIDGHDIDGNPFTEISIPPEYLIKHIDKTLGGCEFAVCGFSLGAQAAQMFIPEANFGACYASSQKRPKASLINITKPNAAFRIPPALGRCSAKTLMLAGGKEVSAIRASAFHLGRVLPNAAVKRLSGFRHGELCIKHPDEQVKTFRQWTNT